MAGCQKLWHVAHGAAGLARCGCYIFLLTIGQSAFPPLCDCVVVEFMQSDDELQKT